MVLLYSLYKLIYFIFGDVCVYNGDVVYVSRLVVSDSLQPRGLLTARVPYMWNSPVVNTGLGCSLLLQVILLTQG